MLTKKQIRKKYIEKRNGLSPDEIRSKSEKIHQALFNTEAYIHAEKIFTYLSIGSEVQTMPIVLDAIAKGKTVCAPRVVSKEQMLFIRLNNIHTVKKSSFGIPEPQGDDILGYDQTSIVLVPGLAFSYTGYRVGYGGGYYDRFLSHIITHRTIGLAFDLQITDEIRPESHDIPMAMIITESGDFFSKP